MKKPHEEEILKVTLSGVIIALFFGILQHIPEDKKFDVVTIEVALKVSATVFFQIVLAIFLAYYVLLGLHLALDSKWLVSIYKGVYKAGMMLTAGIFFFSLTLAGGLRLGTWLNAGPGFYAAFLVLLLVALFLLFWFVWSTRPRNP